MTDLSAARFQMGFSLGFHIIFAAIGIAMPFLMAIAHFIYLRTDDLGYKLLTKTWSKGVAIFFAVGAVSGTVLSFELGLLWPGFMKYAGPIIGMPFSLEGAAFFLEAIALGIFLYGWDRIPAWTHWLSGVIVGFAGVVSALFVICANGWMNSPAGFDWNNGQPLNIDPWAAMFNPAAGWEGLHMVIAAFQAVAFAVGGLHAFLYLKTRARLHKRALTIAWIVATIFSILQPLCGDRLAKYVAHYQPTKLAAMESLFETTRGAPLLVGGIPDVQSKTVRYALPLPKLLSFVAYGDFASEVKGLNEFPESDWPPVLPVHLGFQVMVGIGMLLLAFCVWGLYCRWRRPEAFYSRTSLIIYALCTPLGFLAIEAGWTVTEVGRQPWIIYGLLRTKDAVTPRPGITYTLGLYFALYVFLAFVVTFLMTRQIKSLHRTLEV